MLSRVLGGFLCAVVVPAVLSGCASRSENVAAQSVSTLEYERYSCGTLEREMARVTSRVREVSKKQDTKAGEDAVATGVGLVLFWPALFFLASDDHAAELGRLKGEYEAIEKVGTRKNCRFARQLQRERARQKSSS